LAGVLQLAGRAGQEGPYADVAGEADPGPYLAIRRVDQCVEHRAAVPDDVVDRDALALSLCPCLARDPVRAGVAGAHGPATDAVLIGGQDPALVFDPVPYDQD